MEGAEDWGDGLTTSLIRSSSPKRKITVEMEMHKSGRIFECIDFQCKKRDFSINY